MSIPLPHWPFMQHRGHIGTRPVKIVPVSNGIVASFQDYKFHGYLSTYKCHSGGRGYLHMSGISQF